jgi:hypothetical protein
LGLFRGPVGVRFATPLDLGLPASQVGKLHGGQILIEGQREIVGDLVREGLAAFVKGKQGLLDLGTRRSGCRSSPPDRPDRWLPVAGFNTSTGVGE